MRGGHPSRYGKMYEYGNKHKYALGDFITLTDEGLEQYYRYMTEPNISPSRAGYTRRSGGKTYVATDEHLPDLSRVWIEKDTGKRCIRVDLIERKSNVEYIKDPSVREYKKIFMILVWRGKVDGEHIRFKYI